MMNGYLNTQRQNECYGCESCVQICSRNAIKMVEDKEGFRYPIIDSKLCIDCGLCNKVCPYENMPVLEETEKMTFGGYHKNKSIRMESTSGGAFTAIVNNWCDKDYVIFGATSNKLNVYHTYITDIKDLKLFRKSKYSQSLIGNAFKDAKKFLIEGKKVVFSGTPCQIAGLITYIGSAKRLNLLTIEVICEGVPSPLYIRKYEEFLFEKHNSLIKEIDYRNKDKGKWDFQVMNIFLENNKCIKVDRWFNPFWSLWLNHLMSRPCCYDCPFTTKNRIADITLGDLWGVHLYCPELYDKNGGASLIICNSDIGKKALKLAQIELHGHILDFETAVKYQSPLRKSISKNSNRDAFMKDLLTQKYVEICKKWSKMPSIKLLISKYIWGNRQKVFFWNIKRVIQTKERR